jgi:hypothetical protein
MHARFVRCRYRVTEAEHKLLNEINVAHADRHYGREPFTAKDLLIRLGDAKELYRFLETCHKKLVLKRSDPSDRCGFVRINNESAVPYVVPAEGAARRVVPLFYFQGETNRSVRQRSEKVAGWDLAHLKFCCQTQGVRKGLYAGDECRVVALDEIKAHFPPGTVFEDYW